MTFYFTHGMIMSFIFFQAVVLIIALSNIILLHRGRRQNDPMNYPSVSILVPRTMRKKGSVHAFTLSWVKIIPPMKSSYWMTNQAMIQLVFYSASELIIPD